MNLIKLFCFHCRFILLNLLVLLVSFTGCQVNSKPENNNTTSKIIQHPDSVYTYKTPHPAGTGKIYMGREIAHVISAAGAAWLERDTRQKEENVALAISKLNLKSNSVVADIGAGTGYYTFRIAPKVLQGKIYAVELQDEFISALENRKKELGLTNVEIIKGSTQSPNLPPASIDLAFMVDVYHELEFPREMLQAIHKALKPSGKLLLLEYRAEDPVVQIKKLHKMSIAQINRELNANDFKLFQREDFLPFQHLMLYVKRNK